MLSSEKQERVVNALLLIVYGCMGGFAIQEDLQLIKRSLEENVIPELHLWEYYVINVDANVEEFRRRVCTETFFKYAFFVPYLMYVCI